EPFTRVVTRKLFVELGRIEPALLLGREVGDPAQVAPGRGLRRDLEETFGLTEPVAPRQRARDECRQRLDHSGAYGARDPLVTIRQAASQIPLVARERFIAAIAVERHRDVLPG